MPAQHKAYSRPAVAECEFGEVVQIEAQRCIAAGYSGSRKGAGLCIMLSVDLCGPQKS
jgi:hypothetical protein